MVADFRSRDVAAGGQGAPLVPPFHQSVFGRDDGPLAVVNIGGIANLTVLRPGSPPLGWDTGPGNVLMDGWIGRHQGRSWDDEGRWAAQGQSHDELLALALAQPYLRLPAPKSTGRDLFHLDWLDALGHGLAARLAPADVQATLCELTARTIADDLIRAAPEATELLVCGGGAYNLELMARLRARLAPLPVRSTSEVGLPPLQVEAAAFAWLARQHLNGQPGNSPAVTGACGPRILGALYPA